MTDHHAPAAGRARGWERRYAFLLGLTGAAGALDALAFLHLGKVFNSFQSGNVLFVGLGLGDGDTGLVVRAVAVLFAFLVGAMAGARLAGARLPPGGASAELRVVAIEGLLLAVFAGLWLAVGADEPAPVARVALLAIGAGAMGIQASLSLSLKVPNVVTVALTATVAALGQRAGLGGAAEPDDLPSSRLLVVLIATYAACALVIASLPAAPALALIPLGLLAAGVSTDLAQRGGLARRRGAQQVA
jgi:uncharacterized membrane protein YoaK (UPF0700 family)